jgi:hypothetical protein
MKKFASSYFMGRILISDEFKNWIFMAELVGNLETNE